MRPRILLLNIPRLLRDLLLGVLDGRADVNEMTTTVANARASGIPVTDYDLVIVSDDPRRENELMQTIVATHTRTRFLALRGPGEQATGYTFQPHIELIEDLTTERLLAELAGLGRGAPPREETA
jgi:hypothetical protein